MIRKIKQVFRRKKKLDILMTSLMHLNICLKISREVEDRHSSDQSGSAPTSSRNKFNALSNDSGGLLATLVDGKLRWMTPDGPGELVDGSFSARQTGQQEFVLYPKDDSADQSHRAPPVKSECNAIVDASGGLLASMVEGELRWM